MEEIWKPIPRWEGYEVSSLGRVRSYKKKVKGHGMKWIVADAPQRILRPALSNGYWAVLLSKGKIKRACRIATLVLEAFVGPRPTGMEVCHTDCNKQNDCLGNLRYDSRTGNKHDGVGKEAIGRLTNRQAAKVKLLAARGFLDEELAQRFDVSISAIALCRSGRTYFYVRGPITKHRRGPKSPWPLTDEQVQQIRREGQDHRVPLAELAKRYGVDTSYISLILRGLRRQEAGGPISLPRHPRNKKAPI